MIALILVFLVHGCVGQITDAELQQVTEQIWDADANRFSSADLTYNVAGPQFYTYVNEDRFNEPTYAAYLALLNNYNERVGVVESCNTNCQSERDNWLNLIMQTQPMQIAYDFLSANGLAAATEAGFISELKTYWFDFYSRSSVLDSSGFEHVFVGEVRGTSEVTGFHNWIQGYLEEKAGRWEYGSYQATCNPENIKHSFDWTVDGTTYTKPVTSSIMKASPEYELALYTVCFRARRNVDCRASINGNIAVVKNYDFNGEDNIGSAYIQC
jgi:poly(U)-specific endoribonuclease